MCILANENPVRSSNATSLVISTSILFPWKIIIRRDFCLQLSIYPSGFITAVAVFRKPNAYYYTIKILYGCFYLSHACHTPRLSYPCPSGSPSKCSVLRPNHEAHHSSQCLQSSVTPSRNKPNTLDKNASGLLHAERRVRLTL